MKKLFGIVVVFCLASLPTLAQSGKSTRIHFFNAVVKGGGTVDLKLSAADTKEINMKARTWVIIETTGDSLGILVKDKPYFVHFEPGKSHYFVAQTSVSTFTVVTEKSELEFMMTVSINSARGPEEYMLGKLVN